jgi:Tfp pilus assembly protein PilO
MNLKQLPKEKRNQLILVALVTAIVLGGLGFGLISFRYEKLNSIVKSTKEKEHTLEKMKISIRHADETEAELAEASKKLGSLEEGMAYPPGDLYSWVFETVRRFKVGYKVDLPQYSTAEVAETTLLPKFPYKQVTLSVGGTGFYHDIGKFVADFENQFPHIRIVNLTLDPVSSLLNEEREKLEFKMQLVTLVRPNPS